MLLASAAYLYLLVASVVYPSAAAAAAAAAAVASAAASATAAAAAAAPAASTASVAAVAAAAAAAAAFAASAAAKAAAASAAAEAAAAASAAAAAPASVAASAAAAAATSADAGVAASAPPVSWTPRRFPPCGSCWPSCLSSASHHYPARARPRSSWTEAERPQWPRMPPSQSWPWRHLSFRPWTTASLGVHRSCRSLAQLPLPSFASGPQDPPKKTHLHCQLSAPPPSS
mmetsp:Transcript_52613/g.112514  ORF Transcript_52613/g.112514 Transcript_52613/m.112514 type:complete len:230 (-) Transcript_52613:1362-2051(-)